MKKKKRDYLLKEDLLKAVENTYDNSRFMVRYGVAEDCDFRVKLSLNQHGWLPKNELLELIRNEVYEVIVPIPEHDDSLVLTPKLCVVRSSINENQIFHTSPPEGYLHSVCKYNANYDVYIKLDKEKKTISFLLGDKEKTLELVECSDFVSKPSGNKLLCVTAEELERHIHDEFFNPRMIRVGRYVLRIAPAI